MPSARPDPPTLETPDEASTVVTWTAPDAHGEDIDEYELQYRTLGSTDAWTTESITTFEPLAYTITSEGSYETRARAHSIEGWSQWSDISGQNRRPEFPEEEPEPEPEPDPEIPDWEVPDLGPNPRPDPQPPVMGPRAMTI